MKLKNPLLAVRDMERSKTFYREVLGLHVVMDFGANVTLTGGLCLQTLDTWTDFLGKEVEEIRFGANDSEVYFEEDDFDGFLAHLAGCADVVYVRPPLESPAVCAEMSERLRKGKSPPMKGETGCLPTEGAGVWCFWPTAC